MFWASLCPGGDAALLRIPFLVSQTCRSFAIPGYFLTFIYLHTHTHEKLFTSLLHLPTFSQAARMLSAHSPVKVVSR